MTVSSEQDTCNCILNCWISFSAFSFTFFMILGAQGKSVPLSHMGASQNSYFMSQVQDLNKKRNDHPKWEQCCLQGKLFLMLVFWGCLFTRWLSFLCKAPVSKWTTLKKGLNPWQCGWISELFECTLLHFIFTHMCKSVSITFSPQKVHIWRVKWSLRGWHS